MEMVVKLNIIFDAEGSADAARKVASYYNWVADLIEAEEGKETKEDAPFFFRGMSHISENKTEEKE